MTNEFPEELQKLFEDAQKEQRAIEAFSEGLEKEARKVALDAFPEIENLESEGYRQLSEQINRYLGSLGTEISNIVNRYKVKS